MLGRSWDEGEEMKTPEERAADIVVYVQSVCHREVPLREWQAKKWEEDIARAIRLAEAEARERCAIEAQNSFPGHYIAEAIALHLRSISK